MSHTYYGKYRGIVVSADDPQRMGRIRARVPDVTADALGWALPCVPYGGPVAVPPPGTNVWIEFERGDPDHPIWTGCWWNPGTAPVMGDQDGST